MSDRCMNHLQKLKISSRCLWGRTYRNSRSLGFGFLQGYEKEVSISNHNTQGTFCFAPASYHPVSVSTCSHWCWTSFVERLYSEPDTNSRSTKLFDIFPYLYKILLFPTSAQVLKQSTENMIRSRQLFYQSFWYDL